MKRKAKETFIQRSSRGASPEMKALYHSEMGAGKSRTIRHFFDLSPADVQDITAMLQAGIDKRVSAGA